MGILSSLFEVVAPLRGQRRLHRRVPAVWLTLLCSTASAARSQNGAAHAFRGLAVAGILRNKKWRPPEGARSTIMKPRRRPPYIATFASRYGSRPCTEATTMSATLQPKVRVTGTEFDKRLTNRWIARPEALPHSKGFTGLRVHRSFPVLGRLPRTRRAKTRRNNRRREDHDP